MRPEVLRLCGMACYVRALSPIESLSRDVEADHLLRSFYFLSVAVGIIRRTLYASELGLKFITYFRIASIIAVCDRQLRSRSHSPEDVSRKNRSV